MGKYKITITCYIKGYRGDLKESERSFRNTRDGRQSFLNELFGVLRLNRKYSQLVVAGDIDPELIEEASQRYGCPEAMERIACTE